MTATTSSPSADGSAAAARAPYVWQPGDRLLDREEVLRITCMSKSAMYVEIAAGRFPAPLRRVRGARWVESEIRDYMTNLVRTAPRLTPGQGQVNSKKAAPPSAPATAQSPSRSGGDAA